MCSPFKIRDKINLQKFDGILTTSRGWLSTIRGFNGGRLFKNHFLCHANSKHWRKSCTFFLELRKHCIALSCFQALGLHMAHTLICIQNHSSPVCSCTSVGCACVLSSFSVLCTLWQKGWQLSDGISTVQTICTSLHTEIFLLTRGKFQGHWCLYNIWQVLFHVFGFKTTENILMRKTCLTSQFLRLSLARFSRKILEFSIVFKRNNTCQML